LSSSRREDAVQPRGACATGSTATKTDTPIMETPQSISVVTADQIKTRDAQTIGATLRYTAGISGDVDGGSDSRFGGPQIRGFDMTQQELYLDGQRLPRPVASMPMPARRLPS
jgi:iron complex outermembrane receptor protein